MKLLFDALSLRHRPSGTRTRLMELVPRLAKLSGHEIAVAHGPELGDAERDRLGDATCFEIDAPARGPLQRAWRQDRVWRKLRQRFAFDLAVVDCFPFPRGLPLLGVIHDLRHLEAAGWRGRLATRVVQQDLARCRLVHTVSRAVQEDLANRLPKFSGEVHVVPNGVDGARFTPEPAADDAAIRSRHQLPMRYLLCVGHLEPRKDPETALRVRDLMGKAGLHLPLVFVGQGPFLPEETMAWLRQRHPEHVVGAVLRGVTADELPAILRGAAALIAPARLEGFGMAPLEALACGTPVVASDIPAHREVLGPAALYAAPGDAPEFTQKIERLVADALLRESLYEAGRIRASQFDWDAAARAFRDSLPAS